MDGIATIFNGEELEHIHSVWGEMQAQCNVSDMGALIQPHFTWHVAENYRHEEVLALMENLCGKLVPFVIRTSGLGIFTGEKTVIYIGIVKTRGLLELHEQLWDVFSPLANQLSLHYSPARWVPHITIYYTDPNIMVNDHESQQNTACILNEISHRSFEWEIEVNNLAYGRMVDGKMEFEYLKFTQE